MDSSERTTHKSQRISESNTVPADTQSLRFTDTEVNTFTELAAGSDLMSASGGVSSEWTNGSDTYNSEFNSPQSDISPANCMYIIKSCIVVMVSVYDGHIKLNKRQ